VVRRFLPLVVMFLLFWIIPLVVPWAAFAQEAQQAVPPPPKIDSGDTAWMLTSSALVLMMTIPGLFLFYGGLVRRKNALGTIMHSFILAAVISVQWVLWGYSLAFGPDKAGLIGGLGMAPSGDIGDRHAIFQPSHGTAPDIAGRGIANPLAAIWTASLMLDHLGEISAAAAVFGALQDVVRRREFRTPDLGGRSTTSRLGDAVVEALTAGVGTT